MSQITDSINFYKQLEDYEMLYEFSNKILKHNPFLKEAINIHKIASSRQGIENKSLNTQHLCDYKSNNMKITNEIIANTRFHETYYNSTWQLTTKNKASYIRYSEWEPFYLFKNEGNENNKINTVFTQENGVFYDYNMKGKLLCKGNYVNGAKNGVFEFYYENGNISSKISYNNNNFIDTTSFYFENGSLHQSIAFSNNTFKIISFYDELGNNLLDNGTGMWEYSKPDYSNKNTLKIKGNYNNFERHGEWICFFGDDIFAEEKFKNGKFISGKYYPNGKSLGSAQKTSNSQIQSWIFNVVSLARVESHEFSENIDLTEFSATKNR